MLDLSWTHRAISRTPYPWLATRPGDLFDLAVANRLVAEFPTDGFVRTDASEPDREKTYRNSTKTLVDPTGETPVPSLSPSWTELVAALSGKEYRSAVARLLGQPLADAIEIRLVRHHAGDWLSPHTDRADKLFSHILYFTPNWRAEWGGCLEILRSADPSAVVATVVPQLGASALLARSNNSWHQVTAVRADVDAPARTSLLVHGLV
jgi:hypothetical protein